MEDSTFRIRYQKYKCKVKLWEKDFRKKHGRIPSKHDIRDSSTDVRDAYRMYYKLKTSLLENTLQDALDDDEDFDCSLVSQMESSLSQECLVEENFSNLSELKSANVSISNLLTDQIAGKVTVFEAEHELEQNTKAWGKELNKKKMTPNLSMEKTPVKLKIRAPTKLLMGTTRMLPKRNPRKSLSSHLSNSSLSMSTASLNLSVTPDWKEALPDLETLLNEKSKQAQETSPIQSTGLKQQSKEPLNQLDEGWLSRQTSDAETVTLVASSSRTKKYGLSNISLPSLNSSVATTIDTSNSFGISALSMNSFSEVASARIVAKTTAYDRSIHPDSDEVVENSEDESGRNDTLIASSVRHVVKKRKVFSSTNIKSDEGDVHAIEAVKKDLPEPKENDEVENQNPENNVEQKTILPRARRKAPVAKLKKVKKIPVSKNATRRILTRARKTVSYTHAISEDEASRDPYENLDDEDKDPDFITDKKDYSAERDEFDESNNDVSDAPAAKHTLAKTSNKESKTTRKSRATAKNVTTVSPVGGRKRRSGSVKKSPASPRIGGNTGKGRKKVGRSKKEKSVAPEDLPKPEEDFNEYVLEFGIESLSNVPRIDIGELKKSTETIKEFIQGVPAKKVGSRRKNDEVESANAAALRKKVAAGKLNENFVRVDLKKKVFVRGKKTINYSRYKKSLWKKKKVASLAGPDMDMGGCDGGVLTCFQCGGVGHMARSCKVKGENLLPLDAVGEEESPFPTLEEADSMAKAKSLVVHANKIENLPVVDNPLWKEDSVSTVETTAISNVDEDYEDLPPKTQHTTYIGHAIPDDFIKKSGILEYTVGNKDQIEPITQLLSDGSLPPTPNEIFDALRMFGHTQFRAGQERAIMRVLSGISTLVTLSTGSGKSLCYQLPAYIYRKHRKCVVLVISPLVSLMEDQVHGVPDFLNAQCLHTNQTPKVREKTMAAIASGELDVLLISPEAVVSGEKSTGFGSLLRQLPPIAFACIDEAHCVSQWSHNFRPSYLMICRVLKEKLGVRTILGLTATATYQTRHSIVEHLGIPDGTNGIISDIPLPDNLILTVSKDPNRDAALLNLLRSDRFSVLHSIIVYCTRRDECERIAGFLRTCFQETQRAEMESTASKKRKRLNYTAEPYHAGLPSYRRKTIQNAFMSGDLRIVVATIAFGMGINKSDIRAIIHYNMPKNFESYVQEVGRAGRDGEISHCHLFLDNKGNDKNELKRHIYANSIDRHVIRKLLQKIFVPCACVKNFKDEKFSEEHQKQIESLKDIDWSDEFHETLGDKVNSSNNVQKKRICPGHEVCFSIESTVRQLDIPEENISTLLCYLELHKERYIQVLSRAYLMCKVMSYAGPRALRAAAKQCPPLAMAIALDSKKGISHETATYIEFPVIDIAASIGWDSGVVKFQLKNLEWTVENNIRKRTAISVSFSDLGFRMRAPGDLTDDELDTNLDSLYARVTNQEKTQLIQLQSVFSALSSVAFQTYVPVSRRDCPEGPSHKLKKIIREYFQTDITNENIELIPEDDDTPDTQLMSDIRTLIQRYPENNFSGRTVARIFHGVQSPNYPAVIWGRCNFWRAHTSADFNRIVRLANAEIVRMRT
ncbi:ATP-dependent DNA helicase Q4-like isoform X1 [Topomyia yanbarensis]|uniref:ATP-dependent DNA helicase Q4-like isoform X1 n=1 Tax=Topomyia yanbarensis TaxID=2498891 RepID=UPI00273C913A|nr:ATP-dependent DNA helicase Q4-like isoform X1 [Topomyia yanbarensis]